VTGFRAKNFSLAVKTPRGVRFWRQGLARPGVGSTDAVLGYVLVCRRDATRSIQGALVREGPTRAGNFSKPNSRMKILTMQRSRSWGAAPLKIHARFPRLSFSASVYMNSNF
jgi:hypothetical protein